MQAATENQSGTGAEVADLEDLAAALTALGYRASLVARPSS